MTAIAHTSSDFPIFCRPSHGGFLGLPWGTPVVPMNSPWRSSDKSVEFRRLVNQPPETRARAAAALLRRPGQRGQLHLQFQLSQQKIFKYLVVHPTNRGCGLVRHCPHLSHWNHQGYSRLTKWDEPPSNHLWFSLLLLFFDFTMTSFTVSHEKMKHLQFYTWKLS